MLNREIPFRPKLEGDFRVRFYSAVSEINEQTSPIERDFMADENRIDMFTSARREVLKYQIVSDASESFTIRISRKSDI